MTTPSSTGQTLRALAAARRGVIVPGAFNALSARVIADLGFEAIYVTGAGVTNMSLGLPDQGFMGLAEIAEHTARIRDAVELPLLVDADTGFGNALNVYHTVRVLERAGADCIQLEDQVAPKRCGHFAGKAVITADEMVGKIHAAVDARSGLDFLVMARTDARSTHSFEETLERARHYAEAGADILFVEALESADEVRHLTRLVDTPQLMNMVIGGRTPILNADELGELGFAFVLYANAALQGAVAGMQRALTVLRERKEVQEDPALVTPFRERQRLVGMPFWDALETKYAVCRPAGQHEGAGRAVFGRPPPACLLSVQLCVLVRGQIQRAPAHRRRGDARADDHAHAQPAQSVGHIAEEQPAEEGREHDAQVLQAGVGHRVAVGERPCEQQLRGGGEQADGHHPRHAYP